MKRYWGFVFAVFVVGCSDDDLCSHRSLQSLCVDYGPQFDAGTVADAGANPSTMVDAAFDATAPVDPTVIGPDGAVLAYEDAAVESEVRGAVFDFCDALYARARAWRDLLDECCLASGQAQAGERDALLADALLYRVDNMGHDSVDSCGASVLSSLSAGDLIFDARSAGVCTSRWSGQFEAPPTTCPMGGFDVEALAATIGHQAASQVQLQECRAVLRGRVAYNGACTNSNECSVGLRCLGTDNAKYCREALSAGNTCAVNSECADGLLCVGLPNTAGGRVCRPANEPLDETVTCQSTSECRTGLVCIENQCVLPVASPICQ